MSTASGLAPSLPWNLCSTLYLLAATACLGSIRANANITRIPQSMNQNFFCRMEFPSYRYVVKTKLRYGNSRRGATDGVVPAADDPESMCFDDMPALRYGQIRPVFT